MNLNIDPDVKAVLEFMQANIAAPRLVGIANRLPEMAKLLWGHHPQEPCVPGSFHLPKMVEPNRSRLTSSECVPAQ